MPTLEEVPIEEIYDRLYREVFGKRSYRKDSLRNATTFGRVRSICLFEDADPAVWILANMLALRDSPVVRARGFQPNMLSGDNARGRYNAYVRRTHRRSRHALEDAELHRLDSGRLRAAVLLGEEELGSWIVRSAVMGERMARRDVYPHLDAPELWVSVRRQDVDARALQKRLGAKRYGLEVEIGTVSAMIAVVNSYRTGLAHQVGSRTQPRWEDLGDLLATAFEDQREALPCGSLGKRWGW